MDVAGRGYDQFTDAERQAVLAAFPREPDFKSGIIDAFYQGMKHRPDSTFGTFNDDFYDKQGAGEVIDADAVDAGYNTTDSERLNLG